MVGTCRVLVSPQTTVAACGASGLPDVDLGELLVTRLDAEFVQPDAVWMTDEGEVVLREQPTVGLGATQ